MPVVQSTRKPLFLNDINHLVWTFDGPLMDQWTRAGFYLDIV